MKYSRALGATGALVVLTGFVACSSATGEASPAGGVDGDAAGADVSRSEVVDGTAPDGNAVVDASDSGDAGAEPCTADWCETPLPIPDGGKLTLMDVWVPAPNDAWAVSEEGLVLRWNGAQWAVVWDAHTPLYGVRGDHEGAIWLVGAAGAIFRGSNGANWMPIPSGVTTDLMGICEGARDAEHVKNIAIVGVASTVLRWTGDTSGDGKPLWDVSTFGPTEELYSISCQGTDVWVSGTETDWWEGGGRIYRHDGTSWTAQSGASEGNRYEVYHSIWVQDPKSIWLRGKGTIARSIPADDGVTLNWEQELSGSPVDIKRPSTIWASGPNDVWIASSHGRVHHWDGSAIKVTITAKSWDVLNNNLHSVSGSGPDDVWVVGDNIALRRNVQNKGQD